MLDLLVMKHYFVWLGSGRTRKFDVSPKALYLDLAARARLPVPNGGVILDELYRLLLDEGVLRQTDNRVEAADPVWLWETVYHSVRFPRLANRVAVRGTHPATAWTPLLAVDFQEPSALAESLCAWWTAVLPQPESVRRDVLVMEMVDVKTAGTAVSRQSESSDQFSVNGERLVLPKLKGWGRPSPDLPDHLRRAQMLLRGTRRTFGKGNWQIDWADDGRVCWLLQLSMSNEQ